MFRGKGGHGIKKYVVRLADGSEQRFMRPVHDTMNEAIQCIMDYVAKCNDRLQMNDPRRMSPFDFKVEGMDVDDEIADFKDAVEYLGLKDNGEYEVYGREKRGAGSLKKRDVEKLVRELNPRHVEALIALNELFTIAEAWNKADGFVPDFSDKEQRKYFPWFVYDKDVAQFSADGSMWFAHESALLGARLCVKTIERAEQFGQRFAGLFNKFLMLDRREEVSHEND